MAKESSFDVVSEVDLMEVDNAYQQAVRELSQRYDLKDSGAMLELSKKEGTFTIALERPHRSRRLYGSANGCAGTGHRSRNGKAYCQRYS